MKIYEVSYIGSDDLTKHHFFTDKKEARKLYTELNGRKDRLPETDIYGDEVFDVKCLFDIQEMEVEISKKGILDMLNTFFYETQ